MVVTVEEIRRKIGALGLSGMPVCLHSSLGSFGRVEGGAGAVVRAFLEEGCTLLVPVFSSIYAVAPPAHLRFGRNGWDYERLDDENPGRDRIYTPDSDEIDDDMGAIPAAVLGWPGRARGRHPTDSFAAVGGRAAEMVSGQTAADVYAPLESLARAGGLVALAGVGLERMTLLHLAEKEAGRELFRRWANDADGNPSVVLVGGCSEGFGKLGPRLRPIMREGVVGRSTWTVMRADAALSLAAGAIRDDPRITHCGDEACERCDDAVAGGPVLPWGGAPGV